MHKIFVGSDTARTRQEAEALVATLQKKGVRILRFNDVAFDPALAKEAVFAQDLFGVETALYFDSILDAPEYGGFYTPDLKTSPNTLIIREQSPDKETLGVLNDIGTVMQCTLAKKTAQRDTPFALADAHARRDRKQAWVLYRGNIDDGAAPEEIHGTLFWVTKLLLLAQKFSREEAIAGGISAPNYYRYKEWSKKFSEGELEASLRDLVRMYHRAHRGEGELENLLEIHLLG